MDIANNTPDLQPTQPSIQWEPEALLPEKSGWGVGQRPTLRLSEATPLNDVHSSTFTNYKGPHYNNFLHFVVTFVFLYSDVLNPLFASVRNRTLSAYLQAHHQNRPSWF